VFHLILERPGGRDIQGIGGKHVTWSHHLTNQDAVMGTDEMECKRGSQWLIEAPGWKVMSPKYGMHEGQLKREKPVW
jgi:hypothetical protein